MLLRYCILFFTIQAEFYNWMLAIFETMNNSCYSLCVLESGYNVPLYSSVVETKAVTWGLEVYVAGISFQITLIKKITSNVCS